MDDFVALGVLPGAAGIHGLLLGGPAWGLVGLFGGLLVGVYSLYGTSETERRLEELEREVEELRGRLEEEEQ